MTENGFCPCGNFGVVGQDCLLCGKPFASNANTIAPESAEHSANVLEDHKDTDIEEFVARYNPRLRLAEALEEHELSKFSLPEVAELLSLFSEEQLELLTVCEPGELAQLLAGGPGYPSWEDYADFYAEERGSEDRSDIAGPIGDSVEFTDKSRAVVKRRRGSISDLFNLEVDRSYRRVPGSIAIAFGQLVSLISLVYLSLSVQFDGEDCFESLTVVVLLWPLIFFVGSAVMAVQILRIWFAIGVGTSIIGRRNRIFRPLLLFHIGWATFIYVFFVATSCL